MPGPDSVPSQNQSLVLTDLYVPYSLESGSYGLGRAHERQRGGDRRAALGGGSSASWCVRVLAKREQLKIFQELLPEGQDQFLVLTVLYVPYSLDSGSYGLNTTMNDPSTRVMKTRRRGSNALRQPSHPKIKSLDVQKIDLRPTVAIGGPGARDGCLGADRRRDRGRFPFEPPSGLRFKT